MPLSADEQSTLQRPSTDVGLCRTQGAQQVTFARSTSWICLLIAAAILVGFRLHAFPLPLETDECNYAYIGERLLHGERLYVDLWDHQPFGVFVLFAAVIQCFGNDPTVFRMLALSASLMSLWLIFRILQRQFGLNAAVCGGMLFAIASSDPGTAGEGCNREIYMNTCVLAAWWLALQAKDKPYRSALLAGITLAIGSAIKTILAVHWLGIALYLFVTTYRSAAVGTGLKRAGMVVAGVGLGPLALWVAAYLYFATTGRAQEFVEAVFLFNLKYAGGSEPFWQRFVSFFAPPKHPFTFHSALPLWLMGIIAFIATAIVGIVRKESRYLLISIMVASSFFAVCLPGRAWPHYYYLLIPPLIIAVAAASHLLARCMKPKSPTIILIVAVFALPPLALLFTEYHHYLKQDTFGITILRYNSRDWWGKAMGEKVQSVTEPTDTVFVYGSDTGVYYYADRRCGSRFTMITGLSRSYRSVEGRREIMLSDLSKTMPRVILVLFDEPPFPTWQTFLTTHYDPVGLDTHDRTGKHIMYVFARKDRPIEQIDWEWDRNEIGGYFPSQRK